MPPCSSRHHSRAGSRAPRSTWTRATTPWEWRWTEECRVRREPCTEGRAPAIFRRPPRNPTTPIETSHDAIRPLARDGSFRCRAHRCRRMRQAGRKRLRSEHAGRREGSADRVSERYRPEACTRRFSGYMGRGPGDGEPRLRSPWRGVHLRRSETAPLDVFPHRGAHDAQRHVHRPRSHLEGIPRLWNGRLGEGVQPPVTSAEGGRLDGRGLRHLHVREEAEGCGLDCYARNVCHGLADRSATEGLGHHEGSSLPRDEEEGEVARSISTTALAPASSSRTPTLRNPWRS